MKTSSIILELLENLFKAILLNCIIQNQIYTYENQLGKA